MPSEVLRLPVDRSRGALDLRPRDPESRLVRRYAEERERWQEGGRRSPQVVEPRLAGEQVDADASTRAQLNGFLRLRQSKVR
jgi:hypothetical protein